MKEIASKLLRRSERGIVVREASKRGFCIRATLALLLLSGLILVARPLFAQVRPDTYVSLSPVVKEGHAVKGTVEKVVMTVGNLSNIPAPADVHYTALMRVFSSANELVCQSNAYYGSLPPGNSFKALQFQVAHPSPIAQLGPAQSAQPKGPPIAEVGPVLNHVQYRILVNLIPTKPCPQVDSNCNNNMLNPTIQFSAGGTPSCLKLQ